MKVTGQDKEEYLEGLLVEARKDMEEDIGGGVLHWERDYRKEIAILESILEDVKKTGASSLLPG